VKTNKSKLKEEEIDILELLKKWWSSRRLVFFGTIIIGLLSLFGTILNQNFFQNQKQEYITLILSGDLGENNSRIISAFKSYEYIEEAIMQSSLDLSASDFSKNVNIMFAKDPLSEKLQDIIVSLSGKDIKSLNLSEDNLKTLVGNLKDSSKALITIKLYHLPLNLSANQAQNFILKLTNIVNKNLIQKSSNSDLKLRNIKLDSKESNNDYELLNSITNSVSSIQSNLSVLNNNYSEILTNYDLNSISNKADFAQLLVVKLSNKMGNDLAIERLDIDIKSNERQIKSLKDSLEYLDINDKFNINSESNQQDNDRSSTTQLDGEVFDKILSIGSELQLNSFKLETISKIQDIEIDKNNLMRQKELLLLPIAVSETEYSIEKLYNRIENLSILINDMINQVRNLTEPKNPVTIVKNPELSIENSVSLNQIAKLVGVLSLLAFFIISFISLLLPSKKVN